MKGVSLYAITLPRSTFFAGEEVPGIVNLVTTQPIDYKALRVCLVGKSNSEYTQGDSTSHYESLVTYEEKHLRSAYARTCTVYEGESDVYFNPPWAPSEGILNLSVSDEKSSLVIHVKKYHYVRSDGFIGSTLVDVASLVSVNSPPVTLTLSAPNKDQKSSPSPTITLVASWSSEPSLENDKKTLNIKIISALNLGSKSDVYIEVYEIPKDSVASQSPPMFLLPPGSFLQLPQINVTL